MLFENHKFIIQNIINLKNNLSNKKMNYNILLWNDKNNLTQLLNLLNDKKIENKYNKKDESRINIEENIKIEKNKDYDNDITNNDNSDESFNSLLNQDNSSDENSNRSLFNSGVRNNNLCNNSYSNFDPSESINEREINNDNYVYISNTGKKYHSKQNCRKMKISIKVPLEAAKYLGKKQCSLCKFD